MAALPASLSAGSSQLTKHHPVYLLGHLHWQSIIQSICWAISIDKTASTISAWSPPLTKHHPVYLLGDLHWQSIMHPVCLLGHLHWQNIIQSICWVISVDRTSNKTFSLFAGSFSLTEHPICLLGHFRSFPLTEHPVCLLAHFHWQDVKSVCSVISVDRTSNLCTRSFPLTEHPVYVLGHFPWQNIQSMYSVISLDRTFSLCTRSFPLTQHVHRRFLRRDVKYCRISVVYVSTFPFLIPFFFITGACWICENWSDWDKGKWNSIYVLSCE